MSAPGVTLTFTLQDNGGNPVQGAVKLTLVNFGSLIPSIPNTSIVAQQVYTAYANAEGVGSVTFWGNYQLNATNSFYTIGIFGVDATGDLQSGASSSNAYQFNAGGTFDLSNLIPISGYPGVPTPVLTSGVILTNPAGAQTISIYPLNVPTLVSESVNAAASGFIRLSSLDVISWRNSANSADLSIGVNSSNQFTFNNAPIVLPSIVNAFTNGNSFSGQTTFTGAITVGSLNGILTVDGHQFTTLQLAMAALPGGVGIVYVPSGTLITGPVDIPSGVHVIFGEGTFVNQAAGGTGNFFNFLSGCTGASISGQGVGVTILQNPATSTLFGSVYQDSGTENTVENLTCDGNNSTVVTMMFRQSTRSHCHNIRSLGVIPIGIASITGNGTVATVTMQANVLPPLGVVADPLNAYPNQIRIGGNLGASGHSPPEEGFDGQWTLQTSGTTSFTFNSTVVGTATGGWAAPAYFGEAIAVEGCTDPEFSNIETYGGQDSFALNTQDNGNWGSIVGGRYSNIFCTLSPCNGFTLNAVGAGQTITGVVVENLRVQSCGFTGTSAGTDDESGIVLVGNLTPNDGCAVSDCSFTNISCNDNGGPGLRVQGQVTRCSFQGSSEGNGLHQSTTYYGVDGVITYIGAVNSGGASFPTNNLFNMSGNKGNGTYFINEDSGSSGNMFVTASPDPNSIAGYSGCTTAGGFVFRGSMPNPVTATSQIYNQSGVGPTISGLNFEVYTGSTPTLALEVESNQACQFAGNISTPGLITTAQFSATGFAGFFGATPVSRQTVSGSKAGNAALTSLMAALSALGLVLDTTS